MNRTEHLQWCKDRAMKYVDAGELPQAFASFGSDMGKHLGTAAHPTLMLGNQLFFAGKLNNAEHMKLWIQGFN